MSKPEAKKLLLLAVITVLGVNAFILGKVWLNRSVVVAELTLSERELDMPYHWGMAKEDSSLRLNLIWTTPWLTSSEDDWQYLSRQQQRILRLQQPQFASFRFGSCTDGYQRQQRSGWVLLEFNGQSYQDYLKQAEQHYAVIQQRLIAEAAAELNAGMAQDRLQAAAKRRQEQQQRAEEQWRVAREEATRLFVIDAAADRNLLQQTLAKHSGPTAGQLLLVPADIQLSYTWCQNDKAEKQPEVLINRLAVQSLYVAKPYAQRLPIDTDRQQKTRFQAQVYYGRFAEPWIANLALASAAVSE
ncbi:hypothetical protein AAY72_11645 [Alishewanella sp. WH16-1]|uniref:DUF4824 family protein n=1 Tax=Alishewanella sp. WH16-1 TaxID=1651088 RepID=UPI00070CEDA5|nr:DUF4824 family protein [Alishewanella sp. WH16-1]KRS20809.1 hypothetical protein AAY72_11645 [Alishewanella sp. WH16-1]